MYPIQDSFASFPNHGGLHGGGPQVFQAEHGPLADNSKSPVHLADASRQSALDHWRHSFNSMSRSRPSTRPGDHSFSAEEAAARDARIQLSYVAFYGTESRSYLPCTCARLKPRRAEKQERSCTPASTSTASMSSSPAVGNSAKGPGAGTADRQPSAHMVRAARKRSIRPPLNGVDTLRDSAHTDLSSCHSVPKNSQGRHKLSISAAALQTNPSKRAAAVRCPHTRMLEHPEPPCGQGCAPCEHARPRVCQTTTPQRGGHTHTHTHTHTHHAAATARPTPPAGRHCPAATAGAVTGPDAAVGSDSAAAAGRSNGGGGIAIRRRWGGCTARRAAAATAGGGSRNAGGGCVARSCSGAGGSGWSARAAAQGRQGQRRDGWQVRLGPVRCVWARVRCGRLGTGSVLTGRDGLGHDGCARRLTRIVASPDSDSRLA
jgi:hypothetical protein